ncbi:FAD-dependent oxidoreductase [Candidatus Woesearchaeota archaeon]|nr:FAD-dependent oxidoreductase [Candidatus Woesearchaeota archaeon]MBW3021392.1 FAD-dependent oxidoreductase [Candidatus Woesearchaeota archaeon]
MKKRMHYDTVIVGGGISGMACARRLQDAGKDFLLITKVLGGRILSPGLFGTSSGADYVTEDYKNVLKYVDKGQGFCGLKDYYFFDGKKFVNVYNLGNIKYIPKIIRFFSLVKKVRKHFVRYREQAPYKTVKECFESDPVLLKYWRMSAKEFIKRHKFQVLDKIYGNPVTQTTMFAGSDKVNALYYLGVFFPAVIKTWNADFRNTVKKLTKGYWDRILIGNVSKVWKKDKIYSIKTSKGVFTANNVVLAAPQMQLARVYNVPEPGMQTEIYTYHLKGIRKDVYNDKKVIFFRNKEITQLSMMKDGTDKAYSKSANPDFKKFYKSFKVVGKVYWKPATIIPKKEFIKQKLDNNLYLASDYNISSLEDSFLTGLYAANQIIKNTTSRVK